MILVPCGVAVVAGYISVWQSTMDTKFVHLSISPPSLRPTVDGGASRDEDTITGSGTPSRTSAAAATRTVPSFSPPDSSLDRFSDETFPYADAFTSQSTHLIYSSSSEGMYNGLCWTDFVCTGHR